MLLTVLHCPGDVDKYYLYCSKARDTILNVTQKINFRGKEAVCTWSFFSNHWLHFLWEQGREGAKNFPSVFVVLLWFQPSVNWISEQMSFVWSSEQCEKKQYVFQSITFFGCDGDYVMFLFLVRSVSRKLSISQSIYFKPL